MPRKKTKGPKPGTLYKNVQRTTVGFNITAARRRRGITQQELADKTELDKTTISYYERKASAIPHANLQKIAGVLNISADTILNAKANMADMTASKPLLKSLEKAKTLPPEKQKLIVDLIDNLSK